MQANFVLQAGNNQMNHAQFESRAEGNFLGGAIHLGQDNAGASQFNDFMDGMGMFGPVPMLGGQQQDGFNGGYSNPNMLAGGENYQQPQVSYDAGYHPMEAQPLITPGPYNQQGPYGFDPNMQPQGNFGGGMNPYQDPYAQQSGANVWGNNYGMEMMNQQPPGPAQPTFDPGFNPFAPQPQPNQGFGAQAWNMGAQLGNEMGLDINANINFSSPEPKTKKKSKR